MTRRFFRFLVWSLAGLVAAQISSRAGTIPQGGTALAKSAVLEGNVEYLQVGRVGKNLADEIRAAQEALAVSNKIAGTVLDLRFADGDDSGSAKAAADLFASKKAPLAILVNGETRGEAVALAAILRQAHTGLVFGNATQSINSSGEPLQPDIAIKTGLDDERAFMIDPYATQAGTNAPAATNNLLPFVEHTSEADLVRAKVKDGDEFEPAPAKKAPEPPKPFIHDPVLARAVDLVKGLAVIHVPRS